jgi:hypothetical protein
VVPDSSLFEYLRCLRQLEAAAARRRERADEARELASAALQRVLASTFAGEMREYH